MTIKEFTTSLAENNPPAGVPVYLQALWFDGKDNWQHAHELIQDLTDGTAAWIHAYLHRKEGDNWNADYWYRRAGRNRPDVSLQQEWEDISNELLNNS